MHPRTTGFGWFCRSLILTLALLLPMVAATAFLVDQRQQQRALIGVDAAQSGVPVAAGAQTAHRLLLAVQGEEPEFLLARIDGPGAAVTLCAVPGAALVQAPSGQTTLAACYLAAGPARAAQLLGQTVGVEPQHYFAATPATYAALLPAERTAQLDTRPFLPASARQALGLGADGTAALTPASCEAFLQNARAEAPLPALRALVWSALLRADPAGLAQLVPAAREQSARTLTDLSAQDLHALEQTLAWLADRPDLAIEYDALPTTDAAGGEQLTPEALTRAAALLG